MITNRFYVYRYIRLDTKTPFYVGKGNGIRAKSMNCHNKFCQNIANKHGFRIDIILDKLTESLAFKKEVEFIKLYRSLGYCEANFTDGGEGTSGFSPWNKGKVGILKEDVKCRISETLKGNIPWNFGKFNIYSNETKSKMSKKKLGKYTGGNNPAAKSVICLNNGKKYESIEDAGKELKIPSGKIGCVCKGFRNHTHGYRFVYA